MDMVMGVAIMLGSGMVMVMGIGGHGGCSEGLSNVIELDELSELNWFVVKIEFNKLSFSYICFYRLGSLYLLVFLVVVDVVFFETLFLLLFLSKQFVSKY